MTSVSTCKRFKIAVLTSGLSRGSNFRAITAYFENNALPVDIAFLVVNKRNAPVIDLCRDRNISSIYISTKNLSEFETTLLALCREHSIDLLVLAGFLKKISGDFIRDFSNPILNIHPALLPEFGGEKMYGMSVHKAVHAAGKKISGATVHFVDERYDHGKIKKKKKIDVSNCSTPEEIAQMVLKVEHSIYAKAIWSILSGKQIDFCD